MNNIERIRQALPGQIFDAMMVTSPASRLFATGFSSSAGALIVTERGAWFYTDSRYIEAAKAAITDAQVLLTTNDKPYQAQIRELLHDNGVTSLGFEDSAVAYSGYLAWKKNLKIKMVPAQGLISGLRAVKTPADLEKMKKAQRIAEKSFEEILPLISTKISEKRLAAELTYKLLLNGADDKSFDPIIVSGTKSSLPHGVPGDVKISAGFLTIDFGAKLDGWCSDTTRTLCVGKPDDEMKLVYETVLKAQKAGIEAIHAGVSGTDVDAAARSVIESAGYGEYFGHGFGHTLGLEVHETPIASPLSKDILPAGAVISAEPGIYIPGRFGVRIEDVVFITETGCENITNLPKELIIL